MDGGEVNGDREGQRRVGLVYDDRMGRHCTPDGEYHPECPDRIRVIWNKLKLAGIPQRCVLIDAEEAEDNYLQLVHTKNHINLIKKISSKKFDSRRNRIASKFNSIYFNEGSSEAAYLATGSVVKVAEKVAKGNLDSAFAVVRPPGHHAEADEAMGFCLFNNVATAASYLLNERRDLGVNKILIVDWDVHHGNGTQKVFWDDPRVLFFSVHRHEFGTFYPAGDDGNYTQIGEGPGTGYNINVPWENGRCGDADYLAVWEHILVPVARQYDPDMILVSAGFDAAVGDPLGGCRLTPYGYSVLLTKLMQFAQGKIILALEGGYNLDSIASSALACMKVLLEGKPINGSSEAYPFESTWRVIQAVRKVLSPFWSSLADELPTKLTSQISPASELLISSPDSETEDSGAPGNHHIDDGGIVEQLLKLKMKDHQDPSPTASAPWRSELSKVDVWYATFGSNMWEPRFLCYIQGGQVEGMSRPCSGSVDKTLPKEVLWKTFPHRLFFGHESTRTWGTGGVAFLHPKSNDQDKTHMRLYRITLEQFNDVLFQENELSTSSNSPLFDLADLDSVEKGGSLSLQAAKNGWYHCIVYLGKESGLPMLTMTCPLSAVETFINREIPLRPPARGYANTLMRGLVEGGSLSEEEAMAYIDEASLKRLT